MQRLSNKSHSEKSYSGPQIQHIERIVKIPAQHTHSHSERIIEVEVPVERIVEVEKLVAGSKVDLEPIYDRLMELEAHLQITAHSKNQFIEKVTAELNMQRGALVAIKAQRDIDRNRRLMLIKRIKKEHVAHKKTALQLKFAIGASLLLAITSLIIKL